MMRAACDQLLVIAPGCRRRPLARRLRFRRTGDLGLQEQPRLQRGRALRDPLLRLPHAGRRRHPGDRQSQRADAGAEPQPANRDLRRCSLRDPERRLLRRDHAPEHRRRQRSRSGGPVRRQVRGRRSRRIAAPRPGPRPSADSRDARPEADPLRSRAGQGGAGAPRRRRARSTSCSPSTPAAASCCREIEGAQAERKTLSKQIGEAKQRGEDAAGPMREVAELKETIESGKAELETVEAELGRVAVGAAEPARPRRPRRDDRGGRGRRPRGGGAAELRLRAARPPRDRHRAGPDRHGGRRRASPARASPT